MNRLVAAATARWAQREANQLGRELVRIASADHPGLRDCQQPVQRAYHASAEEAARHASQPPRLT